LVGLKQKILEKKEGKKRILSEGLEEGLVAPLELSDRVMEQVEAMAKELRKISGGLLVLVEGVGKLTKVVAGLGKKEVRKEDKEMETEDVQRIDKQTETEKREDDSEEEEESEEEEGKEDDGKEDGDQEIEEMEEK
jgi:Mg-chelatase subunit ChlI